MPALFTPQRIALGGLRDPRHAYYWNDALIYAAWDVGGTWWRAGGHHDQRVGKQFAAEVNAVHAANAWGYGATVTSAAGNVIDVVDVTGAYGANDTFTMIFVFDMLTTSAPAADEQFAMWGTGTAARRHILYWDTGGDIRSGHRAATQDVVIDAADQMVGQWVILMTRQGAATGNPNSNDYNVFTRNPLGEIVQTLDLNDAMANGDSDITLGNDEDGVTNGALTQASMTSFYLAEQFWTHEQVFKYLADPVAPWRPYMPLWAKPPAAGGGIPIAAGLYHQRHHNLAA